MSNQTLEGILISENTEITITELCQACECQEDWIIELVAEGVLDPINDRDERQWRFKGDCVSKTHAALRLKRDLGVNLAGVALALDLIDEIDHLKRRLKSTHINH